MTTPTVDTTPWSPWFELRLALGAQFAAFVAATVISVPFVSADKTITGPTPVFIAAVGFWPVFALGISFAARKMEFSVRRYVDALDFRLIDLVALLGGVAMQFVVGIGYRLARVDDKDVSKAAKKLTAGIDHVDTRFLLLAVAVGVGAPIMEELFYRGLILNGFRTVVANSRVGSASAFVVNAVVIALSALWFGLIHFQPLQLPALVFVGVMCGIARVKTGRIFTAICLHAGFNLATVVALAAQLGS